jgi:hypothetical protein
MTETATCQGVAQDESKGPEEGLKVEAGTTDNEMVALRAAIDDTPAGRDHSWRLQERFRP